MSMAITHEAEPRHLERADRQRAAASRSSRCTARSTPARSSAKPDSGSADAHAPRSGPSSNPSATSASPRSAARSSSKKFDPRRARRGRTERRPSAPLASRTAIPRPVRIRPAGTHAVQTRCLPGRARTVCRTRLCRRRTHRRIRRRRWSRQRGDHMITPTPTRHMPAPSRSNRSGRNPSTQRPLTPTSRERRCRRRRPGTTKRSACCPRPHEHLLATGPTTTTPSIGWRPSAAPSNWAVRSTRWRAHHRVGRRTLSVVPDRFSASCAATGIGTAAGYAVLGIVGPVVAVIIGGLLYTRRRRRAPYECSSNEQAVPVRLDLATIKPSSFDSSSVH